MAKWSRNSINVSSDEVASQSSFYIGSDEAFSLSSINKGSDETFSGSTMFKGSDETYDIFCVPCQEIDKKFLPADGYCINCEEHLCFDCCSNHSKNKTSRQHKLQDKHNMPQSKPVATSSTQEDKHRAPQSKPVATSSTQEDKHRAPQSKPVATSSTQEDKHCAPQSKPVATSSTQEDKHRAPQSKPVATSSTQEDKHRAPQSKPVVTSSTKEDKHCVAQSKPVATSSTQEDKHRAPQSKPVAKKRSSKNFITSLRAVAKDATPHEINIGSSTDKYDCWISGMALLPDSQLVITDYKNKKVKLIDTRHCKIDFELSLRSSPWDITSVQEGRLAVTLPDDQKIQFLTISSHTLAKERNISVNGECQGIAYNNEDKTLIVTFRRQGKVEIKSLSGEVIRCIEMDNTGARIFGRPESIALTNDNTGMYVSDYDKHSVTFLTLDGNIKSVFKNENLKYPKGLCVYQAGRVFVVGDNSGRVYQLVPGTDKLQPLLDKTHGVSDAPCSLSYCDREDKLYVGMYAGDVLKVFQLQ